MIPFDRDQLRDLALLAAAGEATADERAAVEAWLATGDPAAEAALAEGRATLAALPAALDGLKPTADQWRRLESRLIDSSRPTTAARRRIWPTAAGLALAAATLAGLGTWLIAAAVNDSDERIAELEEEVVDQRDALDQDDQQIDQLRATLTEQQRLFERQQAAARQQRALIDEQRQRLDSLSAQLQDAVRQLEFVTEPTGPFATLGGTDEMPEVVGRVFLDVAQNRVRWSVANLTPPGAEQTYQAWGIPQGGDPVSVTTFAVGEDGRATFEAALPEGLDPAQVAVSLEPAGGSETPRGPIVAVGEVQG